LEEAAKEWRGGERDLANPLLIDSPFSLPSSLPPFLFSLLFPRLSTESIPSLVPPPSSFMRFSPYPGRGLALNAASIHSDAFPPSHSLPTMDSSPPSPMRKHIFGNRQRKEKWATELATDGDWKLELDVNNRRMQYEYIFVCVSIHTVVFDSYGGGKVNKEGIAILNK
jgi:hypothetical protein